MITRNSSSSSSSEESSHEKVEPVTNYSALEEKKSTHENLEIEDGYHNTTDDEDTAIESVENSSAGEPEKETTRRCCWNLKLDGQWGDRWSDNRAEIPDNGFNAVAYLTAFVLLGFGSIILIMESSKEGSAWKVASLSIYSETLWFAFGPISLFYILPMPMKYKRVFQFCDYISFYIMIAGTFTPICVAFLYDTAIGWLFFGIAR